MGETPWLKVKAWACLLIRRPFPRRQRTAVATWWEWGRWMSKPHPVEAPDAG